MCIVYFLKKNLQRKKINKDILDMDNKKYN